MDTNLALLGAVDSVLVLYRRCGYRWKKGAVDIVAVHSTVQELWIEAWSSVSGANLSDFIVRYTSSPPPPPPMMRQNVTL